MILSAAEYANLAKRLYGKAHDRKCERFAGNTDKCGCLVRLGREAAAEFEVIAAALEAGENDVDAWIRKEGWKISGWIDYSEELASFARALAVKLAQERAKSEQADTIYLHQLELYLKDINDLKAKLAQAEERLREINMLACYASEEDTSAREAVLLKIGATARGELK